MCSPLQRSMPILRSISARSAEVLITTHKHNDRVKAIVDDESSGRISKQQRMYAFDQLKKEGIQQKNRCILGENGDGLHCERRSEGTKVMCSSCKGFYKKKYFYRHRKHCPNATKVTLTAISSSPMPTTEPDEEWGRVLERMKKDSAYVTITADEVIKVIGRDIFTARKPNKQREAIVKARRAMRRVARLKQSSMSEVTSQELYEIYCSDIWMDPTENRQIVWSSRTTEAVARESADCVVI